VFLGHPNLAPPESLYRRQRETVSAGTATRSRGPITFAQPENSPVLPAGLNAPQDRAILIASLWQRSAISRSHKLTHRQLKNLTGSAKTRAEHEAIAAYYHAKAQHFWAKYRMEEAALAAYYRNPTGYPSKYPTVGDIDCSLASYYERSAERAAALEDLQERLAQKAK
jgi:hypothetical protein